MSWIEAGRYLQKNAFNWTLDTKNINTLLAVLEARRDNSIITDADIIVAPGKKRAVKLNYIPPICDDDGTCEDSVCDGGTAVEPEQVWFEITQCTASRVYTIPFDELRYVDGQYTFTDHALNTFRAALPEVRQKLINDVAAMLSANVGVLPNGNSTWPIPIMNPTNAGQNPIGFYNIEQQYLDSGYSGPIYIIGGTQVFNWLKSQELATANTTIGIDMGRLRPPGNLYYDNLIGQNTFGDDSVEHIIAFNAEMLKFVSYSENAGMFATDILGMSETEAFRIVDTMFSRGTPHRVMGGIIDRRTGLLWDLDILLIDCDATTKKPVWHFQFRLNWDIYFMPPRICNIEGVNSIFHFTTCLPQQEECGDNPYPSPVDASTYTVNTSGTITYPLLLQKVTMYPNSDADAAPTTIYNIPNDPVSIANTAALEAFLNDYQGSYTFADAGTSLSYDGYSAIKIVINDTLTLQFA